MQIAEVTLYKVVDMTMEASHQSAVAASVPSSLDLQASEEDTSVQPKCELCGREFTQKFNLRRHYR